MNGYKETDPLIVKSCFIAFDRAYADIHTYIV